jgi:hypothetical protein
MYPKMCAPFFLCFSPTGMEMHVDRKTTHDDQQLKESDSNLPLRFQLGNSRSSRRPGGGC